MKKALLYVVDKRLQSVSKRLSWMETPSGHKKYSWRNSRRPA